MKRYKVTMEQAHKFHKQGILRHIWYKGIQADTDFNLALDWSEKHQAYLMFMHGRPNYHDPEDIQGRIQHLKGDAEVEVELKDAKQKLKEWKEIDKDIQAAIKEIGKEE